MPAINAIYTISLYDFIEDNPNLLNEIGIGTTTEKHQCQDMFKAKYFNYEVITDNPELFKLHLKQIHLVKKPYYEELLEAYQTRINMLDGDVRTIDREKDNTGTKTTSYGSIVENELGTSHSTQYGKTNTETMTNVKEETEYGKTSTDSVNNYKETTTDNTSIKYDHTKTDDTTNIDLPNKVTQNEYASSKVKNSVTEKTNDTSGDTTSKTNEFTIAGSRVNTLGGKDSTTKTGSITDALTGTDTTTNSGTDTTTKTGSDTLINDLNEKVTISTKGGKQWELKKHYMELIRNVFEDYINEFKNCFILIYD